MVAGERAGRSCHRDCGPDIANTFTPSVEAVNTRSQVLLLTGGTPTEPTHSQQLDIAQLAAAGAKILPLSVPNGQFTTSKPFGGSEPCTIGAAWCGGRGVASLATRTGIAKNGPNRKVELKVPSSSCKELASPDRTLRSATPTMSRDQSKSS